jgi:hypothetical protein
MVVKRKLREGSGRAVEGMADVPFEGLFGNLSQQRVLQELVADPYSTYTPRDLTELTELTEPTVREAVAALVRLGIVRNISRRRMRPVYQVNLDSKRLVALMFLSYAVLDDKYGEDHLGDAVKYYYETTHSSYLEFEPVGVACAMGESYQDIAGRSFSADPRYVVAAVGV